MNVVKLCASPFHGGLAENEVHIWFVNLDIKCNTSIYDLKTLLSKAEQYKAEQFKFDEHKDQYIIAHAYLRLLLATYVSSSPINLEFEVGKFGKPFLKNNYINKSNIHFNMSHSGTLAAYVITSNLEVGIDIENLKQKLYDIDEISLESIFTHNEISSILKNEGQQCPAPL